jgi:hypothetical protein
MTKLVDIKVERDAIAWYGSILKGWLKQAGSKPTDAMLMVPVLFGKRPGAEALHLAMCLRPEGCTVTQFVLAGSCGPANNYRRAMVKTGWFSCVVEGKPYAFKLSLTAKGEAKLAKLIEARAVEAPITDATKPAKGKVKKVSRKRNAAKVIEAPADLPVEAPVDVPAAEPVAPEALADLAAHFNA